MWRGKVPGKELYIGKYNTGASWFISPWFDHLKVSHMLTWACEEQHYEERVIKKDIKGSLFLKIKLLTSEYYFCVERKIWIRWFIWFQWLKEKWKDNWEQCNGKALTFSSSFRSVGRLTLKDLKKEKRKYTEKAETEEQWNILFFLKVLPCWRSISFRVKENRSLLATLCRTIDKKWEN